MKHTHNKRALGILMLAGALSGCAYLERMFPTTRPVSVSAPKPAPTPAQVSITLANTAWVAFAIDGVAEVLAPKPTLRWWLDSEQISGTGGCNLFTARSRRDQDALRITALTPNGKPCLTLPGSQEDLFFKALEQTRSFRIEQEQSQLVLEDESGLVLARFLRAE